MKLRLPEQIGAELVGVSKSPDEVSLPLSTRMFPYIYVASRRMSLRTISNWLKDTHKLSLSAAAISRALSSPKLHLERLAESIALPSRYVADAYGFKPMNLLFDSAYDFDSDNAPLEFSILIQENLQPDGEDDISRWGELHDLWAVWGPMPHEVRLLLKPYIQQFFSGSEEFPSNEDENF